MTGPAYPHISPAPASNSIGRFVIGVSPIGTIPFFDVWVAVLSQYANSPIITDMIWSYNQAMDLTVDMDNFYDMMFNIATAQGYGLDVWGRIVGVSRLIPVSGGIKNFGFAEAAGDAEGFGQAPFFTGVPLTSNYPLSDTPYRTLIYAKALANITDGSIPAVNQLLLNLFPGRGNCYVVDGGDMTMIYTFEFGLTPVELSIVQNSGVLPTPAGVVASVVQG